MRSQELVLGKAALQQFSGDKSFRNLYLLALREKEREGREEETRSAVGSVRKPTAYTVEREATDFLALPGLDL